MDFSKLLTNDSDFGLDLSKAFLQTEELNTDLSQKGAHKNTFQQEIKKIKPINFSALFNTSAKKLYQ